MIVFILIAVLLFLGMVCIDYYFQPKKNSQDEPSSKQPDIPGKSGSVLGESRFDRCQSVPNDATQEETVGTIENNPKEGNNFEPANPQDEEDRDPEPMDIDVPPLERIEPEKEEYINEEEEILELFGGDAVIASGVSVEEMLQTNRVIESPDSTAGEEAAAGRILYQNKKTEIFGQMVSDSPVRLERIRALMHIHEKLHGVTEETNENMSAAQNMELKDFDISKHVR